MSSLTRLARALDVDVPQLLGQCNTIEARVDDKEVGILTIRDELTSLAYFPGLVDENVFDAAPPTIEHLRVAVSHAEHLRQHGSWTQLGAVLPGLLTETKAATWTLTDDKQVAAYGLLSEALLIASTMVTALGKTDLGYIGLIRAQQAAEQAGNELLQAVNVSALCWVLTKQGRLNDAEVAALRKAEQIEPNFVRDSAEKIAVWGILMTRAARAAVRNDQPDRAEEHMSLARAAAARVGKDHNIFATAFGPTNAGMEAVHAAVESERFDHALELAKAVPEHGWVLPTWRARYLLDLAIAHSELNQDDAASEQLHEAERIAPEWMRYHTLTRHTVRELAERARRRKTPIQLLADRLDIEV